MLKRRATWLGLALVTGFGLGFLASVNLLASQPAVAQESRPQHIIECDRLRAKTIELTQGDGTQRIQFVMDKDGGLNIHLHNAGKEGKLLGQLQFSPDDPPTLRMLDKNGKVIWKDR